MLLQSQNGEIHLLPALPDAWKEGYIKGLRARGGYTVDLYWKDGKILRAVILPDFTGEVKIRYGEKTIKEKVDAGKALMITPASFIG
jgi:alpha-L-fucosidase 2